MYAAVAALYPAFLLLFLLRSPASAAANDPPSTTPATEVSPGLATALIIFVALFFFSGAVFVALRWILDTRCWGLLGGSEPGGAASHHRAPQGLGREAIEALPSYLYAEFKMRRAAHKGELECAVCLHEFQDHEVLRQLPGCSHVFHCHCVDPWLTSQATCPVCRSNLQPSDDTIQRSSSSGSPASPEHVIAVDPCPLVHQAGLDRAGSARFAVKSAGEGMEPHENGS